MKIVKYKNHSTESPEHSSSEAPVIGTVRGIVVGITAEVEMEIGMDGTIGRLVEVEAESLVCLFDIILCLSGILPAIAFITP